MFIGEQTIGLTACSYCGAPYSLSKGHKCPRPLRDKKWKAFIKSVQGDVDNIG